MSELSQSIQEDIRAAEPGWCSAVVRCGLCSHEQVSVFVVESAVADLQCGNCGQQGDTIFVRDCSEEPEAGEEEE